MIKGILLLIGVFLRRLTCLHIALLNELFRPGHAHDHNEEVSGGASALERPTPPKTTSDNPADV